MIGRKAVVRRMRKECRNMTIYKRSWVEKEVASKFRQTKRCDATDR